MLKFKGLLHTLNSGWSEEEGMDRHVCLCQRQRTGRGVKFIEWQCIQGQENICASGGDWGGWGWEGAAENGNRHHGANNNGSSSSRRLDVFDPRIGRLRTPCPLPSPLFWAQLTLLLHRESTLPSRLNKQELPVLCFFAEHHLLLPMQDSDCFGWAKRWPVWFHVGTSR